MTEAIGEILKEIGEVPVIPTGGDTSVLRDTPLAEILQRHGYPVSNDNTDHLWNVYWDLVYENES